VRRLLLILALSLLLPLESPQATSLQAWTWGGITASSVGATLGPSAWITMTGKRRYLIVMMEDDTDFSLGEVNFINSTGSHPEQGNTVDYVKSDDLSFFGYYEQDSGETVLLTRTVIIENWTSGGINANSAIGIFQDGSNNCKVYVQGDGDLQYYDSSAARSCAFAYLYVE